MRSVDDLASELDEGLKLIFQAGIELSLAVQANAMTAEPADQAKLSLTFHRLARGVRQTAALRMRLAREAERAGREETAEVIQLDKARTEARKTRVRAAVERLIWTEVEPDERDDFIEVLGERLDALDIADPDEAMGDLIPRIAKDIGLASPTATPVILRSGDPPDPGDPSGLADPESQLGSPASTCGRAEDDAVEDDDLLSDDCWRSSG
jgi:hypothetical protein